MNKLTESGRLSAEIKLLQEIIQHNVLGLPRLGACRDVCLLKLERNFPHMILKVHTDAWFAMTFRIPYVRAVMIILHGQQDGA